MIRGLLLIIFSTFLVNYSYSQNNELVISKISNSSRINIVQNGSIITYNLNNAKDVDNLITKLCTLSSEINDFFQEIKNGQSLQRGELKKVQKISIDTKKELLGKIDSIPYRMMTAFLNDSNSVSILLLEAKIKDLQRERGNLQNQLREYKLANPSFQSAIDSANRFLISYDIVNYHIVIEGVVQQSLKTAAKACLLRAKNYELNYKFQDALFQSERALGYDTLDKNVLKYCADLAYKASYPVKSLFYLSKILKKSKISTRDSVDVFTRMGEIFLDVDYRRSFSQFQLAEKTLLNLLGTAKRLVDTLAIYFEISNIRSSLSEYYIKWGRLDDASICFNSSFDFLKAFKEVDSFFISILYKKYGTSYYKMRHYDSACKYLENASLYFPKKNINFTFGEFMDINYMLGDINVMKGNFDTAILKYKLALQYLIKFKEGRSPWVGSIKRNIAVTLMKQGKFELAKGYLLESKESYEKFLDRKDFRLLEIQKLLAEVERRVESKTY